MFENKKNSIIQIQSLTLGLNRHKKRGGEGYLTHYTERFRLYYLFNIFFYNLKKFSESKLITWNLRITL